ncbi:hypothetical protein [Flavobacterium alkalisoli]|uniref:hypothetical protein n=1 Tax=Flavobacterium alkalisoli TaxID=2602769 RepID=UPI003A8E2B01
MGKVVTTFDLVDSSSFIVIKSDLDTYEEAQAYIENVLPLNKQVWIRKSYKRVEE